MTLDLDQLRNVCLGDEELMRELMSALIEDTSQQIELLRCALDRSDTRECVRVAHYAKCACAKLGAVSAPLPRAPAPTSALVRRRSHSSRSSPRLPAATCTPVEIHSKTWSAPSTGSAKKPSASKQTWLSTRP